MTSAMDAYAGGRHRPMRPRFGAEAGQQLQQALRKAASRYTSDKAVLASVRSSFPKTAVQFTDSALLAVTRELAAGACSWCAYRQGAALAGEALARPTPALNGLLGSRCGRCKIEFRSRVVADRERAALAATARQPTRPAATPQAVARRPASAPWYGSRRRGEAW
jgi:hypothetical protein